jgi:NAD(P)-dependent dehydrogenase (short-subunit alcohol dehydrogenase family)
MAGRLEGKTAIVIGGARGIGAAVIEVFGGQTLPEARL